MRLPFISLVVVNYNGKDIIGQCLPSLINVDYPKDKYEIIVVDNASTDNSISIIKKFPDIEIIKNRSNLGYVGVNSCLEKIKGKYIFILNNDLEMKKNCLKKLVEVIEKDNSIGVVAPKFINYFDKKIESSGTWVSRSFYTGHYSNPNEKKIIKEIPYLGIELIRTNIAKKFGYIYDPTYFIYAEDLDLSLRFRLLGYKTVYVPEAVIYHMHAVTTKKSKSYKMTYLMERNYLITFFKVLSLKNIFLFLPYAFLMRFFAIIRDLLTLRFMNSFARIYALLWILIHFNLIHKKRKEVQRLRKVNDSFLFRVFSEKYLFTKSLII